MLKLKKRWGEIMFYLFFSLSFLLIFTTYLVLKFCIFKENEKFKTILAKILKIISIVYCGLIFVSILLPDAFSLCYSKEELANRNVWFALIRWLSFVPFITMPISIFFENKTIKNIAVISCIVTTILNLAFFSSYLEYATSTAGRGLNSISILSNGFKNFLINTVFRSFWFGLIWVIQLLFGVVMLCEDFKQIKISKKDVLTTSLSFLAITFLCIPIFVPQHLFGHSEIIFSAWSVPHILWLLMVVILIVSLYFIFRNKSQDTKRIVCIILSLCLFIQYNQMFSAIIINAKRFPFQLCNIGAYLILASLIFKNQKLFNFTFIVNLTGAIFALMVPDLENNGLFQLYNMHFILEHTNILVIPILALCFKLFKPVDKYALKDCLIGFSVYFGIVLLLGTTFNAIALKTSNDFFKANYLFMFDKNVATSVIKGVGPLFDITWKIGNYIIFYPVIQPLIFIVFVCAMLLVYLMLKFIYFILNKIQQKRQNNL